MALAPVGAAAIHGVVWDSAGGGQRGEGTAVGRRSATEQKRTERLCPIRRNVTRRAFWGHRLVVTSSEVDREQVLGKMEQPINAHPGWLVKPLVHSVQFRRRYTVFYLHVVVLTYKHVHDPGNAGDRALGEEGGEEGAGCGRSALAAWQRTRRSAHGETEESTDGKDGGG